VTSLSVQLFTVPTIARMLILDHDVLEVVLGSFMDHLRPAINGMFEFLSLAENKRITFAFTLSFFLFVTE
ncbi:unnamed protein product, partial [Porites evermanni]